MLLKLIKGFWRQRPSVADSLNAWQDTLARANNLMQRGDNRSAITEYRKYLEVFPDNVEALNNLACCLVDIGNNEEATRYFQIAFILDDSYPPAIVNHAKQLGSHSRSEEAIAYLRQAKSYDPNFHHVDSVYAGILLARCRVPLARQYALRAWLGSFDNLRFANCYLFYCAYDDIDEAVLAAEHRFWAETLQPLPDQVAKSAPSIANGGSAEPVPQRVKIGYWSPDFRDHSVRYFFRPLLENQDRTRFEVFLYYDFPLADNQTSEIKNHAEHFFEVSSLSDQNLLELIGSHQLDILVELAGHSSFNRINLLKIRLARLQLSGFGYPPTTGLQSVDGKILDAHIVDSESPRYYTERPVILPNSFWCFDPMEEIPIRTEPPSTQNGYITFACIGNIAKTNMRILTAWSTILQRVPNSRLVVRSISFSDPAAQNEFSMQLQSANIDPDRVDLHGPVSAKDYFASYNDVDIVLDTYPFNGGTTSCFAAYMGVPIVTWAGHSLISRMGQSILGNLGLSDWVTFDEPSYVDRAVTGAQDIPFLQRFRLEGREIFQRSALGNGAIFAREFETCCLSALEAMPPNDPTPNCQVGMLPARELVRRAFRVLQSGQQDAAQRIIDFCLRAYPDCGTAHILWTQRLTTAGRFEEAAEYLLDRLSIFDPAEQLASLVNVARFWLLADKTRKMHTAVSRAKLLNSTDPIDCRQVALLGASLAVHEQGFIAPISSPPFPPLPGPLNVSVLIICDDESRFESLKQGIIDRCKLPKGLNLSFYNCGEGRKIPSYHTALNQVGTDILIWMQRNCQIVGTHFFKDLIAAFDHCDVFGIAGSNTWDRLDWRLSPPENKAGCFLASSRERSGFFDVIALGLAEDAMVHGIKVLDGSFLAICRGRLEGISGLDFDPLLEGGAVLLEEDFTNKVYQAGLRLAVHQRLGVAMDWHEPLINTHLNEARWHLNERLGFDPFGTLEEDLTIISVPAPSIEEGVAVQYKFFEGGI